MKRIILLGILVGLFAGCKEKNSFTITGKIKDNTQKFIRISKVDINTPVLIDSSRINSRGAFRIRVRSSEPDFYQLGLSPTNFITLLAEPGEKIELQFRDKNLFSDYTVTGSPGSLKLQTLDAALADTKRKLDSLTNLYNKASKEPGFENEGKRINDEFSSLVKAQRKRNIEFIINNVTSLASIKALYQTISPETYVLYEQNDLQYLKIVTDSLTRHYPNSKHVQALARDFNNELNRMYASKLGSMTSQLPEAKLDPDLKDVNGKRIALSSLRGKYVLLTFWSCKSDGCVTENIQLKNYYNRYKNKGFEIYQINVDENENDWKKAVHYDELPWISTREDDPRNPKNVMLFNVKNLPANYLFDKEGNIIASNIHDRQLMLKLEQLFSK